MRMYLGRWGGLLDHLLWRLGIMLPLLFDRFPNMELAGDVVWSGFGFRGPLNLPVRLM